MKISSSSLFYSAFSLCLFISLSSSLSSWISDFPFQLISFIDFSRFLLFFFGFLDFIFFFGFLDFIFFFGFLDFSTIFYHLPWGFSISIFLGESLYNSHIGPTFRLLQTFSAAFGGQDTSKHSPIKLPF